VRFIAPFTATYITRHYRYYKAGEETTKIKADTKGTLHWFANLQGAGDISVQ